MIVGGPEEIKEVQTLLEKNRYPVASLHTAAPGEDISTLVRTQKIGEVVYCLGAMSYEDALRQMELLPHGIVFRFHAAGSRSLVGSRSKNAAGDAIGQ